MNKITRKKPNYDTIRNNNINRQTIKLIKKYATFYKIQKGKIVKCHKLCYTIISPFSNKVSLVVFE